MRRAEGLEVHEVPFEHLTKEAQTIVNAIRTRRRVRLVYAGIGGSFLGGAYHFRNNPADAYSMVAAAAVPAIMTIKMERNMRDDIEELRALHHAKLIISPKNREEHFGPMDALKPTHVTVGRNGIFFVKETRKNALARFLAKQPCKTFRLPLRE